MRYSFLVPFAEAPARLRDAAGEIHNVYEARKPPAGQPVTPQQLAESLAHFFGVALRLDHDEGETGAILKDDVNQLGDHALRLLLELGQWAHDLKLPQARTKLEMLALTTGDWVLRHQGELRTLEPIVNALATLANHTPTARTLEELDGFIGQVLAACAPIVRQDMEKTNPGRPWRLLHVNRAIVATRTHNPQLMEQAFEEFVRALPEDAPGFFAEGMQQMDTLGYPPHVREVMNRYYERWTHRTLH
jgi:hypothetical protein